MAKLSDRITEIVGGTGGLEVSFQIADFTAEAGFHYYCADTVTAIQMPAIVGNEQVVVSPARGALWSASGIVVTPFSGESINGEVADETFVLNLSGVAQVDFTGDLDNTNWEKGDTITPTTIGNGAYVGNWESYTPSNTQGFGDITSRLQWRRVGESVEIKGDFTCGTVTASEAQMGLPNGYTIDFTGASVVTLGTFTKSGNYSPAIIHQTLGTDGDTFINFGRGLDGVSDNPTTILGGTGFISTGQICSFSLSVPVAEFANSGTTVSVSDFSAKTKWVDETVVGLSGEGIVLSAPAKFQCFRDSDGVYSLYLNFDAAVNNSTNHTITLDLGGTTFAGNQALAEATLGDIVARAVGSTATINLSGTTTTGVRPSGLVVLNGKPSWFDDNAENNFNLDVHFQEATATTAGLVPAISDGTTSAAAGVVGEVISNTGSSITMVNGVAINITSISVTAGDWEIYGKVGAIGAGINAFKMTVGTTTGSVEAMSTDGTVGTVGLSGTMSEAGNSVALRVLATSTTTWYLVSQVNGAGATGHGVISARRMR